MKRADKHKPISEYGWCVASDAFGVVWPTFAETRGKAKTQFETLLGAPLKTTTNYYLVKVYIATAKG